MGKLSRQKGNAFERKVAKMILSTFPQFGPPDCYRTPLSGGHPSADSGDLLTSNALQRKFPYVVECKHVRGWNLQWLMPPTKEILRWIEQASQACERIRARTGGRRRPWLLVMRGNFTPEVCLYEAAIEPLNSQEGRGEYLVIRKPDGVTLVAERFSQFLGRMRTGTQGSTSSQ
jgi:hypothetical protein